MEVACYGPGWTLAHRRSKGKNQPKEKPRAPSIPRWSPILLLTRPDCASLPRSDKIGYIQGGMAIERGCRGCRAPRVCHFACLYIHPHDLQHPFWPPSPAKPSQHSTPNLAEATPGCSRKSTRRPASKALLSTVPGPGPRTQGQKLPPLPTDILSLRSLVFYSSSGSFTLPQPSAWQVCWPTNQLLPCPGSTVQFVHTSGSLGGETIGVRFGRA